MLEEKEMLDPWYYRCGDIKVDEIIDAYKLDFYLANSLKYILRAGKKSDDHVADLNKAIRYLQRKVKGHWKEL